jgi:pseudouridine synthase
VESEGERLRAASVRPAAAPAGEPGEGGPKAAAWLLVTLRQGRNREIRRMMVALNRRVTLLRRIRLGPLRLGDLGSGAFREIADNEVQRLYDAAGAERGQRPGGGG